MKKKLVKLLLFSIIFFSASFSASAQIYVKIRPVVPIVVRTERPSPVHVWIDEEWNEEGDHYKYAGGHWDTPPHDGDKWNSGHWNHHNEHGDQWVRGSWKGKGKGKR
jgi:hypothetical protein